MPDARTVTAQFAAAGWAVTDVAARFRWPLLATLTLVMALLGLSRPNCSSDLLLFSGWGDNLADGRWHDVYSAAVNQGGPLELLWSSALTTGSTTCPDMGHTLAPGILAALLLVLGAAAGAGRFLTTADPAVRRRGELLVGLGVASTLAAHVIKWGHPADVVIPVLWICAAQQMRRGRWPAAAATIAVTVGIESWGVLGAVALLAGTGVRPAVKAAIVAALGSIAWYTPFIALHSFTMLRMQWPVGSDTLTGVLTGHAWVTWSDRIVQSVIVVAAGAVVCRLARCSPHSPWLTVVALVLARLSTDPLIWPYYWTLATSAGLVGAVFFLRYRGAWVLLAPVAVLVVPAPGLPWVYVQLAVAAGALALAVRSVRSSARSSAANRAAS